ncbi:hypothetical protein, partial [Faecalibacterium sp. An122]|uniref:hypothetical protein n=1 Tax=Faecalibacterium sp. An122 TaxID=1965551 RepID=UPI00194E5FE8
LYELLFGILSVSNTLKVPLQVFDIVQFSRSCPLSLSAGDLFILPQRFELVKHFFRSVFQFFSLCGPPRQGAHI